MFKFRETEIMGKRMGLCSGPYPGATAPLPTRREERGRGHTGELGQAGLFSFLSKRLVISALAARINGTGLLAEGNRGDRVKTKTCLRLIKITL